jgi:hypothetical protein
MSRALMLARTNNGGTYLLASRGAGPDQQIQVHMLSVNDRAKKLGARLLKSTSARSCAIAVEKC